MVEAQESWYYVRPPSQEISESSIDKKIPEVKKRPLTLTELTFYKNIHAAMYGVVFEDAIMEMRLLVEGNNDLRIMKLMSDMNELLKIKFGIEEPASKDELEGIDPKNLGCNQYKINKLVADRLYIKEVFDSCFIDLTKFDFETLNKCIKHITERDRYTEYLKEEGANNKCLRRDLIKQLRQQRNHNKSAIYEADVTIDNLKTQVEDIVLVAEARSRYVVNWENARTEQHLQDLSDKENEPSSVINYYRQRGENEHRVHYEVETLSNILISETLNKIEDWMVKFEQDMEAMDLKICVKKNQYQNTHDKRIGYEKMYEKHDELIKMWEKFKKDREAARLYHEKMTKSAIAVQAWWRGLLVRLKLGPYKVSKKKGKEKKK